MSDTAFLLPQPPAGRVRWRYVIAIPVATVIPFVLWPSLLTRITASDFLPHRFCYLSNPSLIWLNVTSDMLIGIAYVTISATLAYLVHRARTDIPFSWMFLAFGLFIVACGGTHFMEVLTVWKPLYWLSGDVKVVTALASVTTALLLPGLVPRTLDLLSAARLASQRKQELEAANSRLMELEKISTGLAARAAAGMALWEWDVRHDRLKWSGDVKAIFGCEPEALPSRESFMELVHADDRQRVRSAVNEALAGRSQYDVEFRLLWPDDTVRWLIGRGRVYRDAAGNPETMIGVNMDVSARKQSEAALQKAEKLAVAGRLAASVAHEINNPLESVTNLLYLIQSSPEAKPEVRKYAATAETELSRVAHVVRQTLGFYRESSLQEPVRVSELLETVLELHAPQLQSKGIVVEKLYSTDDMVLAHAGELRQLFANLVNNAIDAMAPGGSLRLRICGGTGRDPDGVRVFVVDNGVGIPRERRERIFEAFFTTKGDRGTGLGLWVSQSIVEKHGGWIRMRSTAGKKVRGTAFAVFLPRKTAA